MPLTDALLSEFVQSFFGFGDPNAKYWFIGMEEGGGNSLEEFEKRVSAWDQLGKNTLVDVKEYHRLIGINSFFEEPVKLQSTWNKLIRIYLSANGYHPETDDVRVFQKERLGRTGKDTTLLELLPLSSPNTNVWLYPKWTNLPLLRSRESYRSKILPLRVKSLRKLIDENKPKVVVFYGQTNEEYWRMVVGTPFRYYDLLDLKYAKTGETIFVSIKHPVYKGLTNDYFHRIGYWIQSQI
jgi:hypothetical protein